MGIPNSNIIGLRKQVVSKVVAGINSSVWVFIIIGSIIVYFASKSISKPIEQITEAACEVADLDLSRKIHKELVDRRDEVGKLAKSMERIIESLKEVIMASSKYLSM